MRDILADNHSKLGHIPEASNSEEERSIIYNAVEK